MLFFVIPSVALAVFLVVFTFTRITRFKGIPKAHPFATYTPLWIAWIRYMQRENRTLQDAHSRHGPIIQLGPNELSINCVQDGIRVVYGAFEKHDWYLSLWNHGKPNMVAYQDKYLHSSRKRILQHINSKSNILKSPVLAAQADMILQKRLRAILQTHSATGDQINMYYIISAITLDMASGFIFGLRNGPDALRNLEETNQHVEEHKSRYAEIVFNQEYFWLWKSLKSLGLSAWSRGILKNIDRFEDWTISMGDRAELQMEEDYRSTDTKSRPIEDTPVLYAQLRGALMKQWHAEEKEQTSSWYPLTADQRLSIAGELTDQLLAGYESGASALVFLLYHMSVDQKLQERLRAALRTISPHPDFPALPNLFELEAQPLLHAIVYETLRLYPPVAGAQARVVPSDRPIKLAGHSNIPPGTRVSARCYCLHRNPEVFPEPEQFLVDRWLNPETGSLRTDEDAKIMNSWWWVFGSGGRMCSGQHFAMFEMKTIVAAIYKDFATTLVNVNQNPPEPVDQYLGGTKEHCLNVNIHSVA